MIQVGEVSWRTEKKGEALVVVHAFDEVGRVELEITARWTHADRGPMPQVHWRAAGRVSTTVAREFAQAILLAADVADRECLGKVKL